MKVNKEDGTVFKISENQLIEEIENYNDVVIKLSKTLKSANIVGTYAELLVCEKLHLKMAKKSNKDYDATVNNKKYQIKSRWNKEELESKGQNEFGSIKYQEHGDYKFDYLVLVYFDGSLLNHKIYLIDSKDINELKENTNGKKFIYTKKDRLIIRYNDNFISNKKVKEI